MPQCFLLYPYRMKNLFLALFLIILTFPVHASVQDSSAHKKQRKLQIRPVPVIAYAPETRFLIGIGSLATFKLCPADSETHYSVIAAFVAYSQNKQDYIYVPYQLYTKQNKYYFEGEADYYNYSYYYWGIGTQRVNKELYSVRFPRLAVNAYRKILPGFYAGADYFYENDDMWKTDTAGVLKDGKILGSKGSVNSGAGINLFYDTRDSVYFPTKGWYIKVASYFNSPALGSTYTYGRAISDISWYKQVAKPLVLAFNQHSQISWGTVPFNELALVGGSKQMRGYYVGYYRDDILMLFQGEARMHLVGRVGLDAFASMALVGNPQVFPESNSPIYAEGVGIRYNYNVKCHINIRGDIGYGKSLEYYLSIQEAF